jgi:D-alanine-D-alanine ligase
LPTQKTKNFLYASAVVNFSHIFTEKFCMSKKITVGIIFGGRSAEHEVSLQSAKSIIEAIDKEKYELVLIGIDKGGKWHLVDQQLFSGDPRDINLQEISPTIGIVPGEKSHQLLDLSTNRPINKVDVVFPVLHGPYGEDGTMQGLMKLADLPFVGPGVLGSSVSMDKDVMKRLMRDAGIENAKFMVIQHHQLGSIDFGDVERKLGMPVFIKPANMGSSVGVGKANNEQEFFPRLKEALQYDTKVVVEEFIRGREIECSVLGNEEPIASVPGEIIAHHDFYSYEAKYIDEKGASLKIPADLPDDVVRKVQETAIETFKTLCCEGMGRVDMFVTDDYRIFVNEINTLPGFTKISMYPKLWDYSGIPYKELLDRLINLAIARHQRDEQIQTDMK